MQIESVGQNKEFVLEVLKTVLENQLFLAIKQRDDVLEVCFTPEKAKQMIKDYNDEIRQLDKKCIETIEQYFKHKV